MLFRNKKLLVIAGVALCGVLLVVGLSLRNNKNSSQKSGQPDLNSNQKYDKASGETVADPKGKGPETYGVPSGTPVLLGFSKLIDVGLTSDQEQSIETAFTTYAKQAKASQVSVVVSTITTTSAPADSPEGTPNVVTFSIQLDGKTTQLAKVNYVGLYTVEVFVYDPATNTQLFDSGEVGFASDTAD